MSLVDYASSSEDDEEKEKVEEENEDDQRQKEPYPPSDSQNRNLMASSNLQSDSASSSSTMPLDKLPDASLLLNLPAFPSNLMNAGDHSSRVEAAMAESTSRKRESNGSAFPYRQSKLPRGNVPNSKSIPDTLGGTLVPPQLRGATW
ncbi:uncharacterized protein [Aristolochia californica]|uniref:uncharacterized protein isoform X2 n=1 Tax=Aristolochia californica TaxID=171875 RepID=UPI0035D73CE5